MKVESGKTVYVDYKLTVDGAIADQSQPGQPLEFICGMGMLLPKFEEAIMARSQVSQYHSPSRPRMVMARLWPRLSLSCLRLCL